MSEILAPAGGKNSALAAINAGADAIYLGLDKFSARSSAENFGLESFIEVCKYAHAFGVKVYVALNTVAKDGELTEFIKSVAEVWNGGADALILQDLFLGKFIKDAMPEISLHLSTQAGTCNSAGARLAVEYGFERVILARETALSDIAEISKIIETEVFVQGALCTCFSGQCYMSSFAGGNSGNRGKCKQPCRKIYSIDRNGFEQQAYRLSLSDLCVGEKIEDYISAGATSFKIEGRMRRPEYVAAAVNYYKAILNKSSSDGLLSDLKRTYNRGNYTHGLAFGQDRSFVSSAVQGHIGEFAGVIKVVNSSYVCLTKNKFRCDDGFKILRGGKEVGGGSYGGDTVGGCIILSRDRLKNGDKVFVTTDTAVNSKLLEVRRLKDVEVKVELLAGRLPFAEINGFKVAGENPIESAQTRPLSDENVVGCFKKVDGYPFRPQIRVRTDGVFMAASELNAFRRKVYSQYFGFISQNSNKHTDCDFSMPSLKKGVNCKTAVISAELNGIRADVGILKLASPDGDFKRLTEKFEGEKFLFVPPYLTGEEVKVYNKIARSFDGIYCDSYFGLQLAKDVGIKFFAGAGFNITNRISLINCNADYVCLSKELTVAEADALSAENTFYLSEGNIKVMDLIYCPFEKKCASCDKRGRYTLTDGEGRRFPLRRYVTSECRFEVFNCANLLPVKSKSGRLIDKTFSDADCAKTRGHSSVGIN